MNNSIIRIKLHQTEIERIDPEGYMRLNPKEIWVEVRKPEGGTYRQFEIPIDQLVKEAGYL
jgi:hypothetical protein